MYRPVVYLRHEFAWRICCVHGIYTYVHTYVRMYGRPTVWPRTNPRLRCERVSRILDARRNALSRCKGHCCAAMRSANDSIWDSRGHTEGNVRWQRNASVVSYVAIAITRSWWNDSSGKRYRIVRIRSIRLRLPYRGIASAHASGL